MINRMKQVSLLNYLDVPPEELSSLSKRQGWVMNAIGHLVYRTLIMLGFTPLSYKGVCEHFVIGRKWGGVSLGFFFICDSDSVDYIKSHEVGHCIQNAMVGGFTMALFSIASAARCLWRKIIKLQTSYYSWFFEGDASQMGVAYVQKWGNKTE